MIGAVLLTALAIPVGLGAAATDNPAGPVFASLSAHDDFHRNLAAGLGSAELGGAYTVVGQLRAKVQVSTGHANVTGLPPGTSRGAWLPAVHSSDTRVEIRASVPVASTAAAGLYLAVEARRQASGQAYRGKITFARSGKPILSISRTDQHSVETSVGMVGLPWQAGKGEAFTLELQATGMNPTVVSARAWLSGAPIPAWQLSRSDSSPAQVAAGGVGVWSYRSAASAPSGFQIEGLDAWSLSWKAPISSQPSSTSASLAPISSPSSSSARPTPKPSTSHREPTSSSPVRPPVTLSAPPSSSATTPPSAPPPVAAGGAGSVPVGTSSYAVPAGALFVSPNGNDSAAGSFGSPLRTVQAAVNKAAAGQGIVLRAGVYHESVTVSKNNVTIQAYPHEAVWLDGSSAVTGWTKQGNAWVHSGWTAQFDHSASFSTGSNAGGFVNAAYPMAAWPDQVFVNGAGLAQVSSSASVGSGQFAVDYSADTITVGSNPIGNDVTASDLQTAFTVSGSGVMIEGIGVRNYATSLPQLGTVRMFGAAGTLRNDVVQDNATQGISFIKPNGVVDHVTSTDNGMTGIHGNESDNLLIENSLVEGNNTSHFNPSPSAAGIKITRAVGLQIIGNTVQGNSANGIWLDESDRRFTIVNNRSVLNNKGLVTELSDTGIIANNVFSGGEIGVWVLDTGNVQIYNNDVSAVSGKQIWLSQDARRQAAPGADGRDPRSPVPDPSCPWLTRNIVVANNTFTTTGAYQLLALDSQTNIPADSMNLTVNGNLFAYHGSSGQASMIGWGGTDNHSVSLYQTAAAFDAAKGASWTNMQTTSGQEPATEADMAANSSRATPLPAAVAAAIGVAAGTRHIGTIS